ncbi:MAG: serine/threonine protein kinase [Myxococcota bacterium]|jgi:serine/threonine-protein kinase|nr:serine/threonine protein kinase [Myxococcota bacterium]
MAMPDTSDRVQDDAPATTKSDLTRIGRYDLIYVLGRGGMATVYMGQVSGLAGFEKLVTVKVIHQHLAQEQQFQDMFLDEARLSARIQHPNVAATQEVGKEDGLLYMVGEFVEGQSLKTVMSKARRRSTRLSHPMAAYVAACVCDGLHAAHELTDEEGRPLGLVHRDISPPNVMISYQGFVKLIDFGVAQARGRLSHTEAGAIKGKMGYLAPEQLQCKRLDRRCDIFALGVMLYELTSGHHPFPGETGLERLNRIAHGDYRPPRSVEPSIDPKLERIVVKALANRREDRFDSAAEMGAALRQYIGGTGIPMGTEQLLEVMGCLFPDEIAKHRATVKTFREQNQFIDVSGLEPIDDKIVASYKGPGVSRRSLRRFGAVASLALAISAGFIGFSEWSRANAPVERFVQATENLRVTAPPLPVLRLIPTKLLPKKAPTAPVERAPTKASVATGKGQPRTAKPRPKPFAAAGARAKPAANTTSTGDKKTSLKGSPYE